MVVAAVMVASVVLGATMVVAAVMVGSGVVGGAALAAVSVPWRVMPRVVMMRRLRVPMPWRVMPRVVMMMRRLRVAMPWRVMPRVVMVRVRPVVLVMTPHGLDGMDAAVVEAPGVPLARAVPSRQRRLRGQAAAGTAAAAAAGARTAAPRRSRATLRRSRATVPARGDRDGGAGNGCGRRDDDGVAELRRWGRRCRYGPVLRGRLRRRGVHLDDRVDRPAREREHAATADRAQRDGSECAIAREHREAEDGRRPHAARPREHGRAFL